MTIGRTEMHRYAADHGYAFCTGGPDGKWWIKCPDGRCMTARNGRQRFFSNLIDAYKALTKHLS